MRKLQYLSPTSLSKFLESSEEFYLTYLAEVRPPRQRQTQPMSIGSAFDAYAKSYLHKKLFGAGHPDSNKFQFETLFTAQVEPHNRDWARVHGKYVFDQYCASGALSDMLLELNSAIGEPRFEMDICGTISSDIYGVPFLGKPDVFFINKKNLNIISDWKVNGYCSKSGASPTKGFIKRIPGFECHKDAVPVEYRGTRVNGGYLKLHDVNNDWARQTVIYAWLCGCAVGSDFVHAIDQVACNNRYNSQPGVGYPQLSFVQHRYKSDEEYQHKVFRTAVEAWDIISGPPEKYFRGLTEEESASRCLQLEERSKALFSGPKNKEEALFMEMCN
jgi:hypothetical protein